MKKLILAALTLCALFGMTSRMVFAQEKWVDGKIDVVYVSPPEGEFSFYLKGNPLLCNTGNGLDWITVSRKYATAEAIKNLLSTVLAAKLADRTVHVQSYSVPDPTVEPWGCRLYTLGVGN